MSVSLKELVSLFEELWPASGAEDWDAPGLVVGGDSQVSRILMTVDVTHEIIDEAIDGGFDLIIAHHPLMLRGVKSVATDTAKGSIVTKAIKSGVAIFSAHTNADIVPTGVSAALAKAFGLGGATPLLETSNGIGHGRVGQLAEQVTLGEFARAIAKVLPSTATGVRVAGDFAKPVRCVALCGGAGDSFIEAAYSTNADVYVTSDLRHHPVQEILEKAKAEGRDFALVDVSHWAAEWLWLNWAAKDIQGRFASLQIVVSELRTDPWDFAVTQ
ncbi:MAG: Nif3-like dinuclear metal center hexameric protein [Rhodoluna sp.]